MKEPAQLELLPAPSRQGEPAIDSEFRKARRVQLDEHSWLECVPGWLTRDDLLFQTLSESASWEQRKRWMFTEFVTEPRLTAEYRVLREAPISWLQTIGAALSSHYGVDYDSAWLNLYRNQHDGTGWHADKLPSRRLESIVPVLSLGATRRFLIRPRAGGKSILVAAAGGDLVVMGGRCQRDWVHSVPKETRGIAARISINFGSRAVGGAGSI
jgi:alkylated DNA repair dioxygenase AlkB